MKNKYFLMLLLIFLLISISTLVFAQSNEDMDFMYGLGIIDSNNISVNKEVTRGDFAKYVSRILVDGEFSTSELNPGFTDIKKGDKNFEYVNLLASLGIINGDENGEFNAEDSILYEHALKILVKTMGYDYLCDYNYTYEMIARKLGITRKISIAPSSFLKYGDMVILLRSVMECNISSYNTWDGTRETGHKDIYMSQRLGIYQITGIITDDGYSSLEGESRIKNNEIIIGNTKFVVNKNLNVELGECVNAYYKFDKVLNKNVILYVESENYNKELKVFAPDIKFQSNKLTYLNEKGKWVDVNIPTDFILIYNGMALNDSSEYSEKLLEPDIGFVKLIDNDNDGKYEIVSVVSYESYLVSAVEYDNNTIRVQNKNLQNVYKLDKYDISELVNENGEKIVIDEVDEKNVVFVEESLCKKRLKVIVSNKRIYGLINEININKKTCILDNNKYDIRDTVFNDIKNGSEGTFYIDPDGQIAFFNNSGFDTSAIYGYIILLGINNEGGIDSKSAIKIYNENDELVVKNLSNKVKIDGLLCDTYQKISEALETKAGSNDYRQLIRYKENSKGEIIWIDTSKINLDTDEESLQIFPGGEKAERTWYLNARSFEGVGIFDISTKVFYIPYDKNDPTYFDENQIMVSDYGSFLKNSGMKVMVEIYRINKNSIKADACLVYVKYVGGDIDNATLGTVQLMGLVDEIWLTCNDDGEDLYKIGIINTDGKSYVYADQDAIMVPNQAGTEEREITVGDIIRYGFDKNKRIVRGNVHMIWDLESEWFGGSDYKVILNNANYFNSGVNIKHGWVYRTDDDYVQLTHTDPTISIDESSMLCFLRSRFIVYIFNKETKTVRRAQDSDMIAYVDSMPYCSEIIYQYREANINPMFIYE